MDNWVSVFAFIPILVVLFYIAIIVFVVYFMVKVLKNQKEVVSILKGISDKLDQKD